MNIASQYSEYAVHILLFTHFDTLLTQMCTFVYNVSQLHIINMKCDISCIMCHNYAQMCIITWKHTLLTWNVTFHV